MTPFSIACLSLLSMSVLLMVRQKRASSSRQKNITSALAALMGVIFVIFLIFSILTYS
ncbi:Uncharacterised protein [Nocardiopsis dassonvillei]|uniref:Permease n=1 Tax=Nocardiopsis dassonvillei (strain ATCC 23218 / DSM 43111 / CIP 107115 / JCM 7437 / KCTC 9190 / NBRC 14626 / NCTC 10488 / NRRL B-5397 / IMRU 509) TaxID=446468 RepID=D7AUY6_NOCDD|nr:permease [Nocardiopsis dassonvillei subsp. dassonvillei DSM 43111]VEI90046.1 Uncharacterised protein [Nocardiopsis dassonvillei]